jgi:homoaconitase/3-isopropylmalate dehydratase large subunit
VALDQIILVARSILTKKMIATNEAIETLEIAQRVAIANVNVTTGVVVTMISRKKSTYLEKVFEP